MAAMALALAPGAAAAADVSSGVAWIASRQERTGGFPGAGGDSVNSAGLAIQAMSLQAARYRAQIGAAETFLAGQQNADGGFNANASSRPHSDVRATAQAVSGAVGTSFAALHRNLNNTHLPPPPPRTRSPHHAPKRSAPRRARTHPAGTGPAAAASSGRGSSGPAPSGPDSSARRRGRPGRIRPEPRAGHGRTATQRDPVRARAAHARRRQSRQRRHRRPLAGCRRGGRCRGRGHRPAAGPPQAALSLRRRRPVIGVPRPGRAAAGNQLKAAVGSRSGGAASQSKAVVAASPRP